VTDTNGVSTGRLKVALVCDWFLPRFGGLEMQLRDLAVHLAALGHEVHVVTPIPGPEEVDGIRVHRLDVALFPKYGFACTPRALREIRAVLRRESFDVVQCHVSYVSPIAFLGAYVSQQMALPTVVTFHSFVGHFRKVLVALDVMFGWSKWPVVFTAVSAVVAAQFRSRIQHQPIHLLPNGVNSADWRVEASDRSPDSVHVVSVMRLKVRKRPRALLKIIRRVRQRLPQNLNLQVTLVGDGPLRPALERLISRYSLGDTVNLVGHQSRDAIRKLLAQADVFVLPTVLESFGIAALEARLAGVPVVARVQSGISEFITHGREGLLADSDRQMTELLTELILDPGRRASIAAHNRATPGPATDWQQVVERHLELYRDAIEMVRRVARNEPPSPDERPGPVAVQASSGTRVPVNE